MMLENLELEKYERRISAAERFFTRSPFSIVTMVARIKGYVSEEMLKNAVTKIQQRHALLRVRVKDDKDHAQWFTFKGVQEISIEIVPRKSENDWIKIHAEASKIPYEFETRPAIRFILVESPEVCELIILCHHIICDGMSLAYLARDLMMHLGDPAREVEVLPAPAPITLDNLPGDVSQSGLAKFLIKRMNRKWAEESVFFDHADYEILTKAYWDHYHHELFSIEMSEAETSALIARCRKEKITVNSALTTAFCGAQSFVEGEKPYHTKIVVAANLRDRIPEPAGEGMGMYAGGLELKFKYNRKRSFWENARVFHKKIQPKLTNKNLFSDILNWLYLDPTIFEAMNFKKLGGLVAPDSTRYEKLSAFSEEEDVVLRLLQRDNIESPETKHWGTAVTNLGRLDFPKTYGALELDRLIMQPGGGIPLANVNLVLGAMTCAGKLSLVVEYAEEAVDTGTMERIKDKAMEYLLHEGMGSNGST
ncbi:MAG: condensation domain-containing protein [Anaerolineales bacterium]|jgi:NRPS condensation-like uncharacterized protein